MTVTEWHEDFKSYINALDIPRDDYKGIIAYIDEGVTLLKELEPIKPVRDPECGRIWLCGNCGEYVGFEDGDQNEVNEFYNFCHQCGKAVRWNDPD